MKFRKDRRKLKSKMHQLKAELNSVRGSAVDLSRGPYQESSEVDMSQVIVTL